jgi:phage shock protein A
VKRGNVLTIEELLELQSMMESVVNPIKIDMDKRFDSVETQLTEVKEKVDSVDTRLTVVEEKVDSVDTRLRKLEIKVEHKIDNSLRAMMEGLAGVTENMQSVLNVENRVETLEHKTSAIDFYIKKQQQQ